MLHGKATTANAGEMLSIKRDLLLTVKLDNRERFRQIVMKSRSRKEAGLIPGGSAVVAGRLRAGYNKADLASEQMGGLN
jgi:Zn-dependent M16 (insulinase) family peptidase